MIFLDTNIILGYLVRPTTPAEQAKHDACKALFQRVKANVEQVTTTGIVVAEAIYVLISPRQYALSHAEASARLLPILALRGVKLLQKKQYQRALDLFGRNAFMDFGDAVIVAEMEKRGMRELYSYDRDFDRVPGVRRIEPA